MNGTDLNQDEQPDLFYCENCNTPTSDNAGYLHTDGFYYCSLECAENKDANR